MALGAVSDGLTLSGCEESFHTHSTAQGRSLSQSSKRVFHFLHCYAILRTSAPPLTAPPGLALRLSRRASTRSACPPPLILGRIASHGGIDFRRGGNQSPIAWERLRSQAVVEMGLDLRPISTETYIKLREVLIVAVYGLKPLQFLGFCDTILILRKRTASNKQAKH